MGTNNVVSFKLVFIVYVNLFPWNSLYYLEISRFFLSVPVFLFTDNIVYLKSIFCMIVNISFITPYVCII